MIECARERFVTVVSGLPRSGTSLAMQMLSAGGMDALVDEVRPPDAANPRGYHEYAPVRSIARDAAFIDAARGRAIKVVAPLLCHLPMRCDYRVLFLERPLAEVLGSQRAMLGAGVDPPGLELALRRQRDHARAWCEEQAQVRWLPVSFAELCREPASEAERIDVFLGGGLDRLRMAARVEPALAARWVLPR